MATDRRAAIRFEIVGRLRGNLAASPPVRLLNISESGALVEAPWPLQPESVHAVTVDSEHHVISLDARVRHVRPAYTGNHYLIGLEFLAMDEAAAAQVQRLVHRPPSADVQLA